MRDPLKTGHAERLANAAEAKKALLAKFKPRPTVTEPDPEGREAARLAEVERVRIARAEAKEAAKQALVDQEAARQEAIRAARKERQAAEKAAAKAKRDARYALRQSRSPGSVDLDY